MDKPGYRWVDPKAKTLKSSNTPKRHPATAYKPPAISELTIADKQKIGNLVKELANERHKNQLMMINCTEDRSEVIKLRKQNKKLKAENKHLKKNYHQALYIIDQLKQSPILEQQPELPTMLGSQFESAQSSTDFARETPTFNVEQLRNEIKQISDSLRKSDVSSSSSSSSEDESNLPMPMDLQYIQDSIGNPLLLESLQDSVQDSRTGKQLDEALFGSAGCMPAPPIQEQMPEREESSSSESENDSDLSDDSIKEIKKRAESLKSYL